MRYFDPKEAVNILNEYHDRIVTIMFIKRSNSELKILNGMLNCAKYTKNIGMSYNPSDKNLCTIFDLKIANTLPLDQKAKAYRMVNLEQIIEIKAGGKIYRP